MINKYKTIGIANNQINRLKNTLSGSDYKVIKAAECAALGIECEYDLSALHAERQTIRDEINRLELEIAELGEE